MCERHHRKTGFTLVELLVVIAIMPSSLRCSFPLSTPLANALIASSVQQSPTLGWQ